MRACEDEEKQRQESEDEGGLGYIRGLRGQEQDISMLTL